MFSVKGQIANIFDFADHMASVTVTQPCLCSTKAGIGKCK